jgi:hypothetical protein
VIRQSITYGDAETRGKLRAWKKKLATDYAIFDSAWRQLQPHVKDLVLRGSYKGRARAFEKIRAVLGPGVTLEHSELGGKHSHAIFSIFKPRDSVIYDNEKEDLKPTYLQDCVTVNYFVAGYIPRFDEDPMVGVVEGLWTLEVPDHALGRAVERSRLIHPGTLIREAHLNLLALPNAVLGQKVFFDKESRGVYIKAGAGAFAGHLFISPDKSINFKFSVHVRVSTWLSADQLGADQIILSEKGKPGDRLGDGWLRPNPFCRFERNGDEVHVTTWQPDDV